VIVRVFRVWVRQGRAADWKRMVKAHSTHWMKAQPGCIAFYPGKPLEAEGLDFSMASVWTDVDAIRAPVGDDWREAILFGEEAQIAERVEMHHYEVFGEPG
jgi:quinol monooxygenase YgiN